MIIEVLLRVYDLFSFVENKLLKGERKTIGLAKQKLILYLAYVKSDMWPDLEPQVKEFAQYYSTPTLIQRPTKPITELN